jgi:hypothetical protein
VAVRALAKASGLPFGLCYEDGTTVYWTGEGFEASSGGTKGEFTIAVSHFKVGESSFLLSLHNLAATTRAAAIAKTLTDRVHCCPNKVTLDGHSVSNVFNEPFYGASSLRYPLYFLQLKPDPAMPSLRLRAMHRAPDDGMMSWAPSVETPGGKVVKSVQEAYDPCLAGILVTAFLKKEAAGKHVEFLPQPQRSQLVWVADGVEVAREDLGLSPTPTAILVFCSAADLSTDLSGLAPRETEMKLQRQAEVMRRVDQCLAETDTETKVDCGESSLSIGLMIVGGMALLISPPVGLVMVAAVGFSKFSAREKSNSLKQKLDEGLHALRANVTKRWGPGSSRGLEDPRSR